MPTNCTWVSEDRGSSALDVNFRPKISRHPNWLHLGLRRWLTLMPGVRLVSCRYISAKLLTVYIKIFYETKPMLTVCLLRAFVWWRISLLNKKRVKTLDSFQLWLVTCIQGSPSRVRYWPSFVSCIFVKDLHCNYYKWRLRVSSSWPRTSKK